MREIYCYTELEDYDSEKCLHTEFFVLVTY